MLDGLLMSPCDSQVPSVLGSHRTARDLHAELFIHSFFAFTGGILGALFNALNYWLTMFRIR